MSLSEGRFPGHTIPATLVVVGAGVSPRPCTALAGRSGLVANRAILLMLAITEARLSEVAGLRVGDIDLPGQRFPLFVPATGPLVS